MHIIKTSPFQRDIIQYISESFLLMIRYLFKKGLTLERKSIDIIIVLLYNFIMIGEFKYDT